ncbi:hypothetical protein [Actinoplanes sp. ATCC 53533]|uniref:hypothetical protein n=1 Tax=Actinoplanes sp. ATCC 53533 TaxID=1288362 RepID=UPI000F7AEA26|nr:hypothetical protein [Actinoplanes sp. ATCC 53533]
MTVASAGGKWHRTEHACRNANGQLAVHREPVLGLDWARLCRNCWKRDELDPYLDAALYAVQALQAGATWVTYWRKRLAGTATTWTWTTYARMRTQPPVPALTGERLLEPFRGNRKWSATVSGIRVARASVVAQITDILDEVAALIGDPELDSRLIRTIANVAAGTTAQAESAEIHRIGARDRHEAGADAWSIAASTWRTLHRRRCDPGTIDAPVLAAVLARYDHVHDLAALPCQPDVPVTDGDCPHTWARRVYHAYVTGVVQRWLTDLTQELANLTGDQATETQYALAVPLWPPTRAEDAPLAFLAQFPVVAAVDRYVGLHPSWWGHADGNTFQWEGGYGTHRPQIAVLRVPGYAAEQVAAVSPKLTAVPLSGGRTDRGIVRKRLARCGLPLLPQDVPGRSEPSELVRLARDDAADPTLRHSYQRPFAPDAHPPRWDRTDPVERGWQPWEAEQAWTPGTVFLAGVDDVDLLAQALRRGDGGCRVLIAVELPSDPMGHGYSGTVEHVHVDRDGGVRTALAFAGAAPHRLTPSTGRHGPLIATVEASLHAVSADRTALLLAPAACQDPFPVPMNYLVSVTHAGHRFTP